MIDYTAFREACQAILNSPKTRDYAKSYAEMGIKLADGFTPTYISQIHLTQEELIRTQAIYILNNIKHWHGEEARSVRAILKAIAKE